MHPIALILRGKRLEGEGVSRAQCILLRDAAALLLRMKREGVMMKESMKQ